MLILGIETSCDETSAALVKDGRLVLSNIVSSSAGLFKELGGVVPEIASRAQFDYLEPVITKALAALPGKNTQERIKNFDAIAVTYGPGLSGSLLMGLDYAKTLSLCWQKPLLSVNHLLGHLYANWLGKAAGGRRQATEKSNIEPTFPCLHLLVSGGHTILILQKSHTDFEVVGETVDDSAGEAFDKVGVMLGLTYPAGPKLSKLAEDGDPKSVAFPRAMLGSPNLDFSFSGLKTAVRLSIEKNTPPPSPQSKEGEKKWKSHIAASFEEAVVDVLVNKTLKAVQLFKPKSFALSGGVSANQKLRERVKNDLGKILGEQNIFVPAIEYTGDNAAMIAAAAFFNQHKVKYSKIDIDPNLYI